VLQSQSGTPEPISRKQERVMKVSAISACVLVLLTGAAHSQDKDEAASIARQEQKKQKELDAAYKAASQIKQAPATPTDPWGGVRPTNSSSTPPK
jgi:hypothetical protein